MYRTLLKILSRALLVFLATGCSKEELYKVEVYEYSDLKILINATEKDEAQRPITTLKNFACVANLIKQKLGDTVVSFQQSSGCSKVLEVPSDVLKNPLDRISLYSNRSFGPDYPPGSLLNPFLYYSFYTSEFPKPIEEWNRSNAQYLHNLVLINAPDTVKGLTLFIWNLRKQDGRELVDSSWVVLQ